MLKMEHVTVRYGDFTAVEDLSLELNAGQWLMLAGPNGAGKTTLIEAIAGGVPYTGSICWEGQDLSGFTAAERARKIGVLAQSNTVTYAYSVEEVVRLGRYAYRGGFLSGGDAREKDHVERALEMTGLTQLRRASMLTLSGGERQRVFLAQVFAQDPQVLLLDEPANHLDLKYQQQIFSLIREWLAQPRRAVLSVVHDLSLALRWGSHAALIRDGQCLARGSVREVFTQEHLTRAYDMDVHGWMLDTLSRWEGVPRE